MTQLRIRLFGSPSLTIAEADPVDLRSDKARALLAYLAVEAGYAQRRERLAGLLWPDYTERSARADLRRALADLRLAIGDHEARPPYLLIQRESIQFSTASDAWVDASEFARVLGALGARQTASPADALPGIDELEQAVKLYRAPFLEGFSLPGCVDFEEWVIVTREHLQRLAIEALYRLSELRMQQGEYALALPHAWRQLQLDPWQERAQRQVMMLLASSGQRAAALAQYETCRRLLQSELGVEPSIQTQELAERLRRAEPASSTTAPASGRLVISPKAPCPYRGLATFREEDAALFFGREMFTARLTQAVRKQPLVAVTGPSGSGKSSAVFAGLVPKLRQESGWLIASFRPGEQPLEALAAALAPLTMEPEIAGGGRSEKDPKAQARELAADLTNGEVTLDDLAIRVVQLHGVSGPLLIVADQFEELYTTCRDLATRQRFLDIILGDDGGGDPGRVAGLAAYRGVLITLRADFMGQALGYRPFADALQGNIMLLGPMTEEELRCSVERPAAMRGAEFEPGLVARILEDVGREPGALPLLEFALTLLWEHQRGGLLTHEAYDGIGRIAGALACYAENVYSDLDECDRERSRQIFSQLVRPGSGTDDTRRAATRSEVGEANWSLVGRLADRRLVVASREAVTGQDTVEIAHEALILRWDRMRAWMNADRAFRSWQEGLRAALRQWEKSERDEGALLHGSLLAQAEARLSERAGDLSEDEVDFIRAGIALRERQETAAAARLLREKAVERRARRILTILSGVLAVAVVIALSLAAYSVRQRQEALEAYSLSQAAGAQNALDNQDVTAALSLALAAADASIPMQPQVQRVLLDAAFTPGARWYNEVDALFPQLSGYATSLAISPDGSRVLTGLSGGEIVLWDLSTRTELLLLTGHSGAASDLVFSRDGRSALSGGADGQVILWDLETGNEIERFTGHSGAVRAVDLSPDGRIAASGGFAGDDMMAQGELILWDIATGRELRRLVGHRSGVVAARFTPDGTALLASSGDAEIFVEMLALDTDAPGLVLSDMLLWDVKTGEVIRRFEGMEDDAFSLAIRPDGITALAGSFYNNVLDEWNLDDGTLLNRLQGHREGVHSVAYAGDGRRALSASYDDSLILWDLTRGKSLAVFKVHQSDVTALAASADGRVALSAGRDGSLIQWDIVDGQELQRLAGHDDQVWDTAFTSDGRLAITASGAPSPSVAVKDASIRVWDLATRDQRQIFRVPIDAIIQIAVAPDGRTLLSAGSEPVIRVWDLDAAQEVGRLEGHAGPVTAIEFAPDGKRAASASVDGSLIVWDVANRSALLRMSGHGEGLWSLAISPDGHTLLSDSGDSSMLMWDLETGLELRNFVRVDQKAEYGSSGMSFMPDGHRAISCERDGQLIEWDLDTGAELARIGSHPSLRTRIVISPDGSLAMTSGMDGSLMLWDLKGRALIRRSEGHGAMMDLARSPDGQAVLFGGPDGSLTLWQFGAPSVTQLREWIANNRYVP